ncbi:DUF2057 family protein [Celerinatantimonas sp. YJH-8]|uniref:YccT family protein n=1 Tax=Celerinatantimonas sp. YJH-8 TaxID=3228714 RepID=UPI0038C31778
MRLNNKAILLGSLLMGATTALPAMAASFKVPSNYEIMYVDLEDTSAIGGSYKADVNKGHHQFVVRFNQFIHHKDDGVRYTSEPIIIDLKVASDDEQIQLKAPIFYNASQAKQYAQAPEFSIVDQNNNKVEFHQRTLPFKKGFQLTRDIPKEIRLLEGKVADGYDAPLPPPKSIDTSNEYQMLKFWYNKSDDATRKATRIWMIDSTQEPADADKNQAFTMIKFWFKKADAAQRKAFQVWLLQ